METLENMYTKLMDDYDNIQAARRIEKIEAANPYGCNQHGHRKGHGGSSNEGGSSEKSKPEKEGETKSKQEPEKQQSEKKQEEHQPDEVKREGDHFDNIEGDMIDAVAHAIIHNQDVFSSGFGFSTTKKNTIPETKIFIPKEKLSHLRKEYQKSKLNPYKLAEIFVRYDGKRAWNEQYNPKYPSRKK